VSNDVVQPAMTTIRRNAPVRGTQSFVGVMAAVWKRPSLTGLELGWRWSFGLIAAGLIWFFAHDAVMVWALKVQDIGPILARGGLVARGTTDVLAQLWPLLGGIAIWSALAGLGRGTVLRRWDSALKARRGAVIVLAMLRAFAFAAMVVLWFTLLVGIARSYVWTPMERGLEPSYVPGFAIAVTATLLLFIFWAAVSWILRIAPVLAMSGDLGAGRSLRAAMRLGPLKSKLIEINLVMGIVKVALLVLALVFSACPLPFENVESQAFLTWWWIGVGVFYLVASDYFHVVRAAAYDALYRIHEASPSDVRR
jgi:hypothetical protein